MTPVLDTATDMAKTKSNGRTRTAEDMAKGHREISISEFFAKNRHLLGFDNKRKALLTTVKEAVDNALDACEEAGILPAIFVGIEQLAETRFRVTVRDNGPGIVRRQIENIFGKLLYGSKFHRLKMSRGQQGIGISAAGMYGLMTTGKPVLIRTKPKKNKPAHLVELAIDTQKNRAEVTRDEEVDVHHFNGGTGTEVAIELEGRYNRGRQSVDEYLEQTAIANPHAQFIYQPPTACQPANGDSEPMTSLIDDYAHAKALAEQTEQTAITPGGTVVYPRTVHDLPEEAKEIKPHPKGIELGTLLKMIKSSEHTQLGSFLNNEFCRVSDRVARQLAEAAGMTARTWLKQIGHAEAEKLYQAIQDTRLMAPPTNCLSPIGVKQLLAGLLKGVKASFFTAVTRSPAVYRGNPFQIEVALAYGGDLSGGTKVIRFANRVPLLYQQSACCAFKAALETSWRNYGLSQSKNSLPDAPLMLMVHMASVWVPFTSEAKEAIADYDEIRKEIKLAISECGRKLNTYVRRRQRMKRESERRSVFERYIGEVVKAMHQIDPQLDPEALKLQFETVAKSRTEDADMEFDEDGNRIDKKKRSRQDNDDSVVILDDEPTPPPKSISPLSISPSDIEVPDESEQGELFGKEDDSSEDE